MPKLARRKIAYGRSMKHLAEKKRKRLQYAENQANLPKLSLSRPYCTVCKRFQTKEEELDANVYENDDSDIDDFYVPANNR